MKMEHQNNEKVRKVLIGTMSNFQSNHVSLVLVTSVRLFQVQMPSHKGPPIAHVSHIVPKNLQHLVQNRIVLVGAQVDRRRDAPPAELFRPSAC